MHVSIYSENITFCISRVTWVYQDQEALRDNKAPPYVLQTFFVILALKTINVNISYFVSVYMWFLFGFLLKGEPGDQGEQGLKGERGSEVS